MPVIRNTSRNREAVAAIQSKKRVKIVRASFCLLTDGGLISVFGPLRMFLQLFWAATYIHDEEGDTYVNNEDFEAQLREIRQCLLLADQIVTATLSVCKASDRLTIVCTNDGGSYWVAPGQSPQEEKRNLKRPSEMLTEALQWIEKQRGKIE